MKLVKFLRTPYFTEHLQWLLLKVSDFHPATLLKKRFPQRYFSAKFLRPSFDRALPDYCFLSLSANFEKFSEHLFYRPTKKSFHHSGGIPVEFHWSHGKALENDWNKWNIWNSSEIPLEFQQFIILTPHKSHLSKIFVENWK